MPDKVIDAPIPDTGLIPLSQGQFAAVDEADFEWLSQWRWNAHKAETGTWYAVRSVGNGTVRMHREIMGNPSQHVDHIDGDGLNNRRGNLRTASQSQNMFNRGKPGNNTSGFKGVTWDKKYQRWKAQIKVNQKLISLGNYLTPEEASRVYEDAACLHFGEFYRKAK